MPNFNTFMHRKNIFRKEPDFKQLALEYEELKPYLTVSGKNKLKFDFKNPDALRALTCTLLHKYFQKKITIPPNRLIPAVPQRLNYVCWIEDLVKLVEKQEPDVRICGLDIGTGASCIFPILSCHRNPGWFFVGVETDQKSCETAIFNVQQNYMDSRIHVIKISKEQELYDIVCQTNLNHPVTFIMCNPPFFEEEYDVTSEISSNIQGRFKSNSNTSDKDESVVSGGEIAIVGRMLESSRNMKQEVTIYTSMLGRKQSLTHFKQTLSSLSDDNLTWTWAELCQGKTIRYAIAWSFKPGLDLTDAPPLKHGKNKSWKFKLKPRMNRRDILLEFMQCVELIKQLISRELMIAKTNVTRETQQEFEMIVKTNVKTWTNQRKKRREQLNLQRQQSNKATNTDEQSTGTNMLCDNVQDGLAKFNFRHVDNCSDDSKIVPMIASQQSELTIDESSTFDPVMEKFTMDINAAFSSLETGTFNQASSGYKNNQATTAITGITTRKRKNASSCSSSPSRICPSPNDDLADEDNQSTISNGSETYGDSSRSQNDVKRLCLSDDTINMDDIYDYLLCCRVSLTRAFDDLYFELKLEHPCTAASDAYDLFLYFRNKLSEQ